MGQSILIFPEGTRTRSGKIQEFKQGIGIIAQEMKVPIVPVKITGNFEILPKGNIVPRPGKTKIKIGKPMTFLPSESYIKVTEKIRDQLKKL
jgi:1-acyl-sn-glycerol-3-phosphate acyltransferase